MQFRRETEKFGNTLSFQLYNKCGFDKETPITNKAPKNKRIQPFKRSLKCFECSMSIVFQHLIVNEAFTCHLLCSPVYLVIRNFFNIIKHSNRILWKFLWAVGLRSSVKAMANRFGVDGMLMFKTMSMFDKHVRAQ